MIANFAKVLGERIHIVLIGLYRWYSFWLQRSPLLEFH